MTTGGLYATGQRREEVGALRVAEINVGAALWTIPRSRTKNNLEHEIPLAQAALELLQQVQLEEGQSRVFGKGSGASVVGARPKQHWTPVLQNQDNRASMAAA